MRYRNYALDRSVEGLLVLHVLYVNLSMLDLMIWLSEAQIADERVCKSFPTKYEIAQQPTPLHILPLSQPFHLYSSQQLPSPLLFPPPNIFPPHPYSLLLRAATTLLTQRTPPQIFSLGIFYLANIPLHFLPHFTPVPYTQSSPFNLWSNF